MKNTCQKGAAGSRHGGQNQSSSACQSTFGPMCETQAIHQFPVEQMLTELHINAHQGLSSIQVQLNRERFGRNVFTTRKEQAKYKDYLKCLCGPFESLLWASSFICLLTYTIEMASSISTAKQNVQMGLLFVIIVLLEGSLRFYQETTMQNTIRSLNALLPQDASVIRNGMRSVIDISEVVLGDIVELRRGDKVPADVRIFEANTSFKIDNSHLTGESEPQSKLDDNALNPSDDTIMVYFSASVVDGYAKGMVVGVGDATTMGEIIKLTAETTERNKPLSQDMSTFVSLLCFLAGFCGFISLICSWVFGLTWTDTLVFFIAVLLSNVPFGVASFIPICLVITAQRMARRQCAFRSLEAVETLGSTTVLCMDKTGTLTQNALTVSQLWFNNELVVESSELQPDFNLDSAFSPGFANLATVAVLCNNVPVDSGLEYPGMFSVNSASVDAGSAVDTAILAYMKSQNVSCASIRNRFVKRIELPFNSTNKYHMVVFEEKMNQVDDQNGFCTGNYFVAVKGAPEKVIELCSRVVIGEREYDFDHGWATKVRQLCENMAHQGERVLGFCDLKFTPLDLPEDFTVDENNVADFLATEFRFVGLVSFRDPLRASSREAVLRCKAAGIKVIMITGDHPICAKAVARQVGIISSHNETIEETAERLKVHIRSIDASTVDAVVINGTQLEYYSLSALQDVIKNHREIVFARMLPAQKLKVVEALQAAGEIVAVTGDGINDAPALKKANIGVCIGRGGTEIAKESSDLILMDNSISSVPDAVEEGRRIFDNLKKCCYFGLTDTTPCMAAFIVFVTLKIPTPLESLHMLLIAIVIDFVPAVSLVFEKCESDLMTLRPRDLNKNSLVNLRLVSACYGQTGVIEALAGFFSYLVVMTCQGFFPRRLLGLQSQWNSCALNDLEDSYGQEWAFGQTHCQRMAVSKCASTAFFVAVVICQMVNVINLKSLRSSVFSHGLFGNPMLILAMTFDVILTLSLVYLPGTNIVDMSSLNYVVVTVTSTNSILMKLTHRWGSWFLPLPFATLLFLWSQVTRIRTSRLTNSWIQQEFSF